MEMKAVVGFNLVLLYLAHMTSSHDYDHYYHQSYSGSQSQENNSDMDRGRDHHHHHHWDRNSNDNYNTQKVNSRYNNEDECNNCACNKCENPPNCCKKVCDSCPKQLSHTIQRPQNRKKTMPRIEILPMPGMPPMPPMQLPSSPMRMPMPQMAPLPMPMPQMPPMQLPMPQMQMPMPHMPPMPQMPMPQMQPMQMPMPQMSMPMPPMQMPMQMPGPFPSPFPSPLMYFPLGPNFMNMFKNMGTTESPQPPPPSTPPPTTTTTLAPTTTTVATTTPTTQATTTTVATTVLTTQPALRMSNDDQIDDYKFESNHYLKSQREDSAFEAVLKSAIDDFSNIIVKTPEKNNEGNNKYMLTSLRRTKPTWMPKFGIVPIPDNMAQRLMSQLRTVQGRRRRQKRRAIFKSEEYYSD